jgi:hypothetical protein
MFKVQSKKKYPGLGPLSCPNLFVSRNMKRLPLSGRVYCEMYYQRPPNIIVNSNLAFPTLNIEP